MNTVRRALITSAIIGSLTFFSASAFAAPRISQLPSGWGNPQIQAVGPSGQSVMPLRDIIRRDTQLLRDDIKNARQNGGDIGTAARLAAQRLVNDIRNFLGI